MFCGKHGNKIHEGSAPCPSCGAARDLDNAPVILSAPKAAKTASGRKKSPLITVACVMAVIVVMASLAACSGNKDSGNNYSSSETNKTAALETPETPAASETPATPETPAPPATQESLFVGSWAFSNGAIIEFYADGKGVWQGSDKEFTWKITDDRFEMIDSENTLSFDFKISDSTLRLFNEDPAGGAPSMRT